MSDAAKRPLGGKIWTRLSRIALEDFLRKQNRKGQVDSSGVFTLAADKALDKLAAYSLPFDGAWALKLVQAAVVNGSVRGLFITQSSKENVFAFPGDTTWTAESVRNAMLEVNSAVESSLAHLASALRTLLVGEKRGFLFKFKEQSFALAGNGRSFEVFRCPPGKIRYTTLTITTRSAGDKAGLFGLSNRLEVVQRNAAVSRALNEFAFVCPIPLSLDKRRIDGLEHCPHHGYSPKSQLLGVGFVMDGSPDMILPPAPKEGLGAGDSYSGFLQHKALAKASEEFRDRIPGAVSCAVAYLVAAHLHFSRWARIKTWKFGKSHSRVNWIKDGVVIQSEVLWRDAAVCSVGIFLSADGIKTDMTGFKLIETDEKKNRELRVKTSVKAAISQYQSMDLSDLDTPLESNSGRDALHTTAASTVFLASLGLGLFPLKSALMIAGGLYLGRQTGSAQDLENVLTDGLESLPETLS